MRSRPCLLGAVVAVLTLTGCTGVAGNTPTPVPPTTVTTAATPAETELQREMRLDGEAAVATYRRALAVTKPLYDAGGLTEAPSQLTAVATGDYLELTMRDLRALKKGRLHTAGESKIAAAFPLGWSEGEMTVKACEDVTKVRVLDAAGRDRTPKGDRRYVQSYTVIFTKGVWRVSDVESQQVKSFDTYGCNL
jgi:hypothetical protein